MDTPEKKSPFVDSRADFLLQLGIFVDAFAQLEANLQMALWQEAGVSVAVARSIFSGTRPDAARSYMNRLREANSKGESKLLKFAFDQIGVLNSARNKIIHYGATFRGGQAFVTNALLAHTPERVTERPISAAALNDMTADTYRISYCLFIYGQLEGGRRRYPPEIIDDLERREQEVLSQPWLYKPPQQFHRRKERPAHPAKPKHRRGASPRSQ